MPEPAAWRYQKITKPMFDLPLPHLVLTGKAAELRGHPLPAAYPLGTQVHDSLAAFAQHLLSTVR